MPNPDAEPEQAERDHIWFCRCAARSPLAARSVL